MGLFDNIQSAMYIVMDSKKKPLLLAELHCYRGDLFQTEFLCGFNPSEPCHD